MKKQESLLEKMFGSFVIGSSKVPLRSNIFKGGSLSGYNPIGQTGSKLFDMDRKSPLLGNSGASNLLSGYYDRVSELKGYQLLDISKLATSFFADYIINFLTDNNGLQVISILDEEGNNNDPVTERINTILTKDIKIFDFIRDHVLDYVFFGLYFGMLLNTRDEEGHLKFRVEELYDPVTVITKKVRTQDGNMQDVFLARGEDNTVYEVPSNEIIYIANINLRLKNDLTDDKKLEEKKLDWNKPKTNKPILGGTENRNKVLMKESYSTSEPLFYSLILKVKELIIKELLVSLISLRDLSSVLLFLLLFDKSVPLESANELCARATKLANNTNELASFLTSLFDVISFIENTLTLSAKFLPDYNATIGNKNSMLPLDKLSDKLLDIMLTIDLCRANVLNPLGLPSTVVDSTSGSKWSVLLLSERANSRVASFMNGIKDSVTLLVCTIYRVVYNEELDPSLIKLHISEKTSVEYNNQINLSESINGLVLGITSVLTNALLTLDSAAPFLDTLAYLSYVLNLIKDIDPNTESLITDESMQMYMQLVLANVNNKFLQLGIDPPDMSGLDGGQLLQM